MLRRKRLWESLSNPLFPPERGSQISVDEACDILQIARLNPWEVEAE